MKKSKFSEEQMVKILREADRAPVSEAAKKHGISDQTIYAWRRKFRTMEASEPNRLKNLEHEYARLDKIVDDGDLEIEVMKEIAAKNDERVRSASPGSLRREARLVLATSVRGVKGRANSSGPTTVPSLSRRRSFGGSPHKRSRRHTASRHPRGRTALWRASTGSYVTSARAWSGFGVGRKPQP